MKLQGIHMHVNGTWSPMYNIELSKLQEAVGGYIDVVAHREFSIFVDDDGIGRGKAINVGLWTVFGEMLAGDGVVTGGVDHEGNTLPITEDVMMKIILSIPGNQNAVAKLLRDGTMRDVLIKHLS